MPKRKGADRPAAPPPKRSLDQLIADSARLRERAMRLAADAAALTQALRDNANAPPREWPDK